MSSYNDEPISGGPMLLAEGAAETDTDITGSFNWGAGAQYITVYWAYNPTLNISGITNFDWPSDIKENVETILGGPDDIASKRSQVDSIVQGYVGSILWQEGAWDDFRNHYMAHNCLGGMPQE